MRVLAIIAFLLAAGTLHAQEASEAEKAALTDIAKCMVAGLPKDWRQAEVTIELPQPGADSGEVKYAMRRALAGGEFETFVPCDPQLPPRKLVELRKLQTAERAGWKSARFTLKSDGTFDLKYDYPKAN